MEKEYILLGYTYYTYCQGTRDRNYGTMLVLINESGDFITAREVFITAREVLIDRKHRENLYEIDADSVENLTIENSVFENDP